MKTKIMVLAVAFMASFFSSRSLAQDWVHSSASKPQGQVYDSPEKPLEYPEGIETLRMDMMASMDEDNIWNGKAYKYVTIEFIAGSDGRPYNPVIWPTAHVDENSYKRPMTLTLVRFAPAVNKGRKVNSRVRQTFCLDDYDLNLGGQDESLFQEGSYGPYRILNDIRVIEDENGKEIVIREK